MFPFFLALYNGSQVSIVALWATCLFFPKPIFKRQDLGLNIFIHVNENKYINKQYITMVCDGTGPCVLEQRQIYSMISTGDTQEAVASSRHE